MELILRTINVDCAQNHFQEMPFTHYFMKENVKATNYFTKKNYKQLIVGSKKVMPIVGSNENQ